VRDVYNRHQLSGLADPLGLRTGFLIPVFTRQQVNSQFIEQIGPDGRVSGFDSLHPQDTFILRVDGGTSGVGQLPHWGFALGKQVLFGQGDENRDQLEAAMDTPFLEERPMLSIEVAEFLGLKERRIKLAAKIFRELSRQGEIAASWRDATILTSDLREALAKRVSEREVDFTRLVARVEESTVFLAGLDRRAQNLKIVRSVVVDTMRSLQPLYNSELRRWDVRFVNEPEGELKQRRSDLDRLRGLVYVADEKVRGFPDPDRELIDGLRIFQPWQYESFKREASTSQTPSFILYTLRPYLPPIQRFGSESGRMWPLGVALRDNVSAVMRTSELNALNRYSGAKIIVAKPPAIFTSSGMTGELRDALNFMADAHHSNLNKLPFETGVFLRARGNQPNREADAWLQIYERCVRQGIRNPVGLKFEGGDDSGSDALHTEALFLPELLSLMTDRTKFPGRRAIDAAALVQFDESSEVSERRHEELSIEFMRRLGFNLEHSFGRAGRQYAHSEVDGFEIALGYPRRTSAYKLYDLWSQELDDMRRFVIVDDADPTAVLEAIADRSELLLTLRDVAVLNGPSPNVWVFLGSQMRRFASSVASKSRTHYFALLIEAARRHGRLRIDGTKDIIDSLQNERLGRSLHIVTSQATFEHGICSLRFRIVDRLAEYETSERYRLSIDSDGPFVSQG